MKKINKYLNKTQIISCVLSFIALCLVLIFPTLKINSLYWIFISTGLLGNYYFLNKWSKDGITWFRKADKNITRKPSDATFFIVGFYTIIICIIYVLDTFAKVTSNYILMISLYILSLIVLYLLVVITDKTIKKISKIIPKKQVYTI